MWNSLTCFLGMLADTAPAADSHTIFGMDPATLTGGGAAAVLGAVWAFFKIIRKVVGTLFMLCVVYLVMKTAFGVDIAQYITPMFK